MAQNRRIVNRLMGFAALACLLVALFSGCTQWTEEQRKRQSLPDFAFEAWDGKAFTRDMLPKDKPITIFYYDPDCEHCKMTMTSVVDRIDKFGDNYLVIFSSSDRQQLIADLIRRGMVNRPGVQIVICTPQDFLDTFGTTSTPTILWYGADWDLKRANKGRVNREGIDKGLAAARGEEVGAD